MADAPGTPTGPRDGRSAPRKRRRLRTALVVLASIVVVLLILLALAPTIAGAVAPGYARSAINAQIHGTAEVGGVSLSWFGGQKVGPVTIKDQAGNPVAQVNLRLSRGLLGLARGALGGGAMDLGTATVSGSATVVRHADGSTNIQEVFAHPPSAPSAKPPAGPGAQPTKLPQVTASLVLDKLDIGFVDQGKPGPASAVRIPDLSGTATVDHSSTADARFTGSLAYGPDLNHATTPAGSVSISAHADTLTDAVGNLVVDRANIDLSADAKDIAITVADAIAGTDRKLAAAIGDKLQASLKAKGTLANADATLTASSRALNADLAVQSRNGVLSAARPGTIRLDTSGLPSLSPTLAQSLTSGPTSFDHLPTVSMTLDAMSIPIPSGGKPLDLRTAAISVNIETTETSGAVRIPSTDGRGTQTQPFRVAPLKARLASQGLADGVTLIANTAATLAGQSAGTLAVDLAVKDLLDANGAPTAGLPGSVQGSVNLTGVATAIAQPFAEPAGLDLAHDIGPQLDLALKASTEPPGQNQTQGAIPPTHVSLDVKSANLTAAARLIADPRTVKSEGRGIELRMVQVGPLATRLLKNAGVAVSNGGPVALAVTGLSIDLDRLRRGGAGPDLRGVAANVALTTGELAGILSTQGQPPHPWQLAPVTASLDAGDVAKGVGIRAATSGTFDGAPAGTLSVDLRAAGLVKADGTRSEQLPSLAGRVGLTNVATSVGQPWAQGAGIDLPAGLGPQLDVAILAAPGAAAGAQGSGDAAIPPTNVDVSVHSANLNTSMALTIDGRTVRGRGKGIDVGLRSPGVLVGGAAQKSGISVSSGGYLTLGIRDLAIMFDQNWSPRLDQSAASLQLTTGGYSVARLPAPAPAGSKAPPPQPVVGPVNLTQLAFGAHLEPGKSPIIDLDGSGAHQNAPFSLKGALSLDGLLTPGERGVAVTPAKVRPTGTIDITNLPTTLAALASAPAAPGAKPGLDLAKLLRDAVGPTVTINLSSKSAQGASADERAVTLDLHADHFNGGIDAEMGSAAVALHRLDFSGQVTPDLAGTLIEIAGPGLAQRPNLVSPATVTISATPFTVPLSGGTPDFSKAADASFQVGLKGTALVNGVVLKSDSGPPRDLGTVGLQDVLLTATVPLSSLAAGSAANAAQVHMTGGVLGGPDRKIVDLKADGSVPIAGGALAGDLNAGMSLNVLDAAWLDTFLGQPGMVSGAIGQTATVDATTVVQFPAAPPPAQGQPTAPVPAFSRAALTASIKSPRLSTAQPLKATALPDRVGLDQPMLLRWTVDPAWANANLLGGKNLKSGETQPARLDQPLDLTLALGKLVIATGKGSGPLKPGVFLADVQLTSPGASMAVGEGKNAAPAKLKNVLVHLTGGKEPGALGFTFDIDDAGGGPGPGGKQAVAFSGGIYNVADATGNLTTSAARLTMDGRATAIPTALVDAMAKQQGLLVEALGPAVNLNVKTGGASESGGNIAADFSSQRADAHLKGSIRGGAFVSSEPVLVTLKSVTPELGARLVKGLPLVGTFEKRPEDGPATVKATTLTAPIDGNMQKLNGQVVLDLGQARFASSNVFSTILKFTGQKEAGTVGRRLEPITVNIKDGVAKYDRVNIPLGEFSFATEGTVDLVQKRMDVVTYIPAGALTDEAAGALNSGIGRLFGGAIPTIEKATMVPFRTTGPFEKPDTKPDMELFAKSLGNTLLRPDKLIGGSLEDLLKKVAPKK